MQKPLFIARFLLSVRGMCLKIECVESQTNRFLGCVFRVQSSIYFVSGGFERMRLQSTLASGEKAGLLGLNLLNELEHNATRRFSRHHDRIPILLEHKISVQSGQSKLCDHVEFIDMTPTSLRMRFTLA